MPSVKKSMISIRLTRQEKEKIKLLSGLEQKPVSQLVKDLVEKELSSKKLSALDLRKLPRDTRSAVLRQMTELAMPVYNKYKDELYIDETGDGIE